MYPSSPFPEIYSVFQTHLPGVSLRAALLICLRCADRHAGSVVPTCSMKLLPAVVTAILFTSRLSADNVLHPGIPVLDRPTLTALGVQLPITGDDNYNAVISLRYR